MSYVCCGIPRSGSTLLWQLIQGSFQMAGDELLRKEKVEQTHPGIGAYEWSKDDFIFVSLRNPFDVAASRFRLRGIRSHESGTLNYEGLEAELYEMRKNFIGVRQFFEKRNVFYFRYEVFYKNYDVVFNALEMKVPGLPIILMPVRHHLKKIFSLEANRQRSIEPNNHRINMGHIGTVVPGFWQCIIPPWGYKITKSICNPLCEEFRYETC